MIDILLIKKLTWDVNKYYVYRDLVSGAHLNDRFQDIFHKWASSSLNNYQAVDDYNKTFYRSDL